MGSRLPDAPVLNSLDSVVAAAHYNRVRRAFARLGAPQEFVLGERGLRVRLDREVWLCTDSRLDNAPLLAWSRFDQRRRAGLHAPVPCQVFYYHAYARVVVATLLAEVDRRLEARLLEECNEDPRPTGPRVVSLSRVRESRTIS